MGVSSWISANAGSDRDLYELYKAVKNAECSFILRNPDNAWCKIFFFSGFSWFHAPVLHKWNFSIRISNKKLLSGIYSETSRGLRKIGYRVSHTIQCSRQFHVEVANFKWSSAIYYRNFLDHKIFLHSNRCSNLARFFRSFSWLWLWTSWGLASSAETYSSPLMPWFYTSIFVSLQEMKSVQAQNQNKMWKACLTLKDVSSRKCSWSMSSQIS